MASFIRAKATSYLLSAGLLFFEFGPGDLYGQASGIFDGEAVFTITLAGNLKEVLDDREGEPQYQAITLSYVEKDGSSVSIPVRVRTRGNFRRDKSNCSYPPLLLNFSKKNRKNTVFGQQDRLKLVMPCQGDKYVLREYYVYKLYNLVSSKSFRTRLIKVVMNDPRLKPKERLPVYGFFLEEEDQMAERNQAVSVDRSLVRPEQTNREDFLNMAVFQYLIGNTDWSVQYRQNVKLIAADSLSSPSTVPYDFDHAGIVAAPYARPAEELKLSSTRKRRYRGYCIQDMEHYNNVIANYNALKEEMIAVYANNIFLDERYINSTLKYMDQFYQTINHPKQVSREFQYPCQSSGTGNVIIKGLNH